MQEQGILNAKSVYCAFNVGHEDSSRVKESDFFLSFETHKSFFTKLFKDYCFFNPMNRTRIWI